MRADLSRTLGVALLTLVTLLILPSRVAADPVRITSGSLTVGGAQEFFSIGFLVSIRYDLTFGDVRLTGSDGDGNLQNPFSPNLVVPFMTVGDRRVSLSPARLNFTANPNVMPTPFTMSGSLGVFDFSSGEELFSGDLSGSGLATFRFVTTPGGTSVVSGVTYQFAESSPTPEPGTLVLLGSGAATLSWRRRRLSAAAP
jgi:PEP-CTERM motif